MEKRRSECSVLTTVMEEIMSLQKDRRDLLASLSAGVSVWKQPTGAELLRRIAGKDYMAAEDAASVQVQDKRMEPASKEYVRDDEADQHLERYLASVVQDMEDLGHRMLSTAYVAEDDRPSGSDAAATAVSSAYKADELVNSTSRLMNACKMLYKDTNDIPRKKEKDTNDIEEEKINNTFLDLHEKFLRSPGDYENELAAVLTKGEEEAYEKEVEKEKKRREEAYQREKEKYMRWQELEKEYERRKAMGEEEQYRKEMREKEKEEEERWEREKKKEDDPSTVEYLNKGMESTQKLFADNRDGWESVWGSKIGRCGDFQDKTKLSPMHFTHYTPDTIPSASVVAGSALQIYSMEILALNEHLSWPLRVYGMVATRDTVDRNRNILFYRSWHYYQELTENDPFLRLTGPSRAIIALDPVDFEVELTIEEGAESQDSELISLSKRYDGTDDTSLRFDGYRCTSVIRLKKLSTTVQATIVGVRIVEGRWPFKHGCRVACFAVAAVKGPTSREVVLLDCGGEEMRKGSNDYLHLSRNVVSVESHGRLKKLLYEPTRNLVVTLKRARLISLHKNVKQAMVDVHSASVRWRLLLLGPSLSRRSWTSWWIAQQ